MEIKQTNNLSNDKFTPSTYRESGIYLNTDETGLKEYVYFNVNTKLILFLDSYESAKHIFEKPKQEVKENSNGKVSEDFALKMLSIATKHDTYLK